jgi:hypothetical protein
MRIPNGDEVLVDARLILEVICAALKFGEERTKAFFAREEEQTPDRCLAHNLVRFHAKRYLASAGRIVRDLDASDDYELAPLGNNGLQIETQKYCIRIRKAARGQLPAAGSEVLDRFYDQRMLQFPNAVAQEILRLVVLWDVTADYSLTTLALALPRFGGKEPEVYWSVQIPMDEMLASFSTQNGASGGAEGDDLPMSVKDDDELKKEHESGDDD